MSLLSISDFKELSFNEDLHLYYDESNPNLKYTSVTTVIGKYEQPFDKVFWGIFTALKNKNFKVRPFPEIQKIAINGILHSVDSLLRNEMYNIFFQQTLLEWERLTKESHIRGNTIHNYLEDNINESKGVGQLTNDLIVPLTGLSNTKKELRKQLVIDNINDLDKFDIANEFPNIKRRLQGYVNRGCTVFAEKRVHIPEFGIAGMIDVPIFKGNKFCILDWKTNKDELFYEAGYYKKERIGGQWVKTTNFVFSGDMMKAPISHLHDGKLTHYALQLSVYAYILEYWGYELVENGLEIYHIRPNREPLLIKIPYLKAEAEAIIKDHSRKLKFA